jgi:hypothetical protein
MTPLCKYDTAVTLDLIFQRLWLPLKGISKKHTQVLQYTKSIAFTQKIWGLTRDRFWSQWCHWHRCDQRRFRSRFSYLNSKPYSKRLYPCIRGLGKLFDEQKTEVENLVSGPFNLSHINVNTPWVYFTFLLNVSWNPATEKLPVMAT